MNLAWLWVGVLYAAAIVIARRAGADLPKRIALLFYAAVLLFFLAPLTQRTANMHGDILRTIPPWSHVTMDRSAANPEQNDVPLQHAPWAHQVRESWKSLRAPLWNDAAGSGYPLLANGQSSALSPLRLLALPLPMPYAMAAEAAMKLLIALTFTFLFCRGRGYGVAPSLIGAVTFAFGGFLNTWLHFPHTTAACFLPAVLLLADRLAARVTRGRIVAGAVVWTCIVLAGHPETAAHIFVLALLYTIWIVAVEKRAGWRLFLPLGGAMTLAALLSAPFLLPFLEALPKSQRYAALRDKPFVADALPYIDLKSQLILLQPHFFGRAPAQHLWGPAETETVGGFAGLLGIAAFIALATRVRRAPRSPETFFVVATVFTVAVFQSWPLISEGVHAIMPIVAHARFRLLFVALLAVQAAAATDLVRRGERKPLAIGVGVVTLLLAGILLLTKFPNPDTRTTAWIGSITGFCVLLAAAAFIALHRRTAAIVVLLLVSAWELTSVTRRWNPPHSMRLYYPKLPLTETLGVVRGMTHEPFRIAAPDADFFPNLAAMFGLEDIRAHDPMANARYLEFLSLTAGYDPTQYFATIPDPNVSALDYLNVRFLVTGPGAEKPHKDRWKIVYDGPDGRIFLNRNFLSRFFAVRNVVAVFDPPVFRERLRKHDDWRWTALVDELELEAPQMGDDFFKARPEDAPLAEAKLLSSDATDYRLHVDAPRWSLVVSSVPWWPGWKVTRDGKRIDPIRVNGAFLGFAVPPGTHDVRVRYSPSTWWAGLALAAIGVMLCGWLMRPVRAAKA